MNAILFLYHTLCAIKRSTIINVSNFKFHVPRTCGNSSGSHSSERTTYIFAVLPPFHQFLTHCFSVCLTVHALEASDGKRDATATDRR